MERLKQLSLKKAFFCLSMLFLTITLILSIISILGISEILHQYDPSFEIKLGGPTVEASPASENTAPFWYGALTILQFALPVLLVSSGLLTADLLFYRIKLKKPLAELNTGAERIMQNDLNFSIQSASKDELGQLCAAFEAMRRELLKNSTELWRQMEERKRLNTAFAHDLRNPVTVLKGSAKMLKKELAGGRFPQQSVHDSISLIEEYAGRIETYVDNMSGVQRLEELQYSPKNVNLETLVRELSDSIRLLTMNTGISVQKQFDACQKSAWADKSILFNVAENLITNAARYAKHEISICLDVTSQNIVLSVQDDGNGFSQTILSKGAAPFLRGEENKAQHVHFGMGLYICRLLCEKHGGLLKLENTSKGALATASFNISKP